MFDLAARREAGFEVESCEQFNRLGVLGWWLSGKLGRKHLSPFQMQAYELMLPLARLMDKLGIGPGLSLIAVGRKPLDAAEPTDRAATAATR